MIDSTYNVLSKKLLKKSVQDNKDMCLAVITAINRMGKTTVLAVSLMSRENTDNYEFLLKSYEAIGFRRPTTVLTDQHPGLIAAIKKEWGDKVNHQLCLFHVYRDIQKYLGDFYSLSYN